MSNGVERRAQIDAEGVKGLLLIHGGASVAILAFLPMLLETPRYRQLAFAALIALLLYQFGVVCALVHNRLRRKCSLAYERARKTGGSPNVPDPCRNEWLIWFAEAEGEPCVCCWSIVWMWSSILLFVIAGLIVFIGGLLVLSS